MNKILGDAVGKKLALIIELGEEKPGPMPQGGTS